MIFETLGGGTGYLHATFRQMNLIFDIATILTKMKQSISIVFVCLFNVLFLAHPGQAQGTDEIAIQQTLANYLNHTRNQDITALLDDLYPGIFAILPRDQMEAYFRQFFLDDELRFRFESLDVRSISPVFEHSERSFSRVEYHLNMVMQYLAEERDQGVLKLLRENMIAEYGSDNVIMDASAGTFQIQTDKTMLVIRETTDAPWKIMDFDPSLKTFTEQMNIPQEVISHFGL